MERVGKGQSSLISISSVSILQSIVYWNLYCGRENVGWLKNLLNISKRRVNTKKNTTFAVKCVAKDHTKAPQFLSLTSYFHFLILQILWKPFVKINYLNLTYFHSIWPITFETTIYQYPEFLEGLTVYINWSCAIRRKDEKHLCNIQLNFTPFV